MALDKEEQKILTDGEKLKLMTEHEGWGIARQKLVDKILDLQSVKNIELTDPQKLYLDVASRNIAVDILVSFLKEDIEGSVEQHINNNNLPKPIKSYILREEDK